MTVQLTSSGQPVAGNTASNTPGTGVVTATLTLAPALSATTNIQLIAPPTVLSGILTSKFGTDITYTWIVTNVGPAIAYHVVMTGEIPSPTHVVSGAVNGGVVVGTNVVGAAETLGVGEVMTMTYTVRITKAQSPLVVHAYVTSDNSTLEGVDINKLYFVVLLNVMRQ